ncbi:MAG: hypothetical protein D6795_06045 [Deltaproteobacteria bacterium]|nr:MAG: hypothetical protein D6795_06045 [Deltaproteobacteria bacterium]
MLGVVQHVMARGIEGAAIFRDEKDRETFLAKLAEVVREGEAQLLGWALLSNHFHLVLRPRRAYLKDMMRRLMTGYATWFNRRHGRKGHLFQNRYRSIVVEEEPYLLTLVRYVHLNPLRAGLARDLRELDRYPYSGHSVLMGNREFGAQDTEAILSRFGRKVGEARKAYREFVAAGIPEGVREEFRGGGLVRSAGGKKEVLRRKPEERELADERVLGSGEFVEEVLAAAEEEARKYNPRSVDEILAEVAEEFGVEQAAITGPSRERKVARARREFYRRARREAGATFDELARRTGRTQASVWQAVKSGERTQ